jgi:hypothetical protein
MTLGPNADDQADIEKYISQKLGQVAPHGGRGRRVRTAQVDEQDAHSWCRGESEFGIQKFRLA